MQPTPTSTTDASRHLDVPLIIRMATPTDAPALSRLAQLDSAPEPQPVPMLVAEVGGKLHAALSLDTATAVANPFERTAELVALLTARARQLQGSTSRPATWRPRSIRAAPVDAAPRA